MSRTHLAPVLLALSLGLAGGKCARPGGAGGSNAPPPAASPKPDVAPPPRPSPRVLSTAPSSCDGELDYGEELRIEAARVVGRWHPDAAAVDLDLEVDVRNTGIARFSAASVTVDVPSLADLGVAADPAPLAADLPALEPSALVTSTAPLHLRVPAANEDALLARLTGAAKLHATAAELNVLQDDVQVLQWTPTEDRMYFLAHQVSPTDNVDPGPGPFPPGLELAAVFLETQFKDAPTVFDRVVPGKTVYLAEDPAHPFVDMPPLLHRVRIREGTLVRLDQGKDYTLWAVTLVVADAEQLSAVYRSASVCSREQAWVDPPVQTSRVLKIDGDTNPDADASLQPARFNGAYFTAGVAWSGQVSGHVLKPSFGLKLRDGKFQVDASFDDEVSFAGEVEAEAFADIPGPLAPVLPPLCIPLPPLETGATTIEMGLQLGLYMQGIYKLGAGTQWSFERTWSSGYQVHCEVGKGVDQVCTSDTYAREYSPPFTPPTLVEASGLSGKVTATFESLLRIGDDECVTGPGLALDVSAHVSLGQQFEVLPFWYATYGVDITGALDLSAIDSEIKRYEKPLWSKEWEAKDSNAYPAGVEGAPGARRSAVDQRWSVAIDDTAVPNGVSLARVAALPDGTAVAAGPNAWIARVDGAGNLLWSFDGLLSGTQAGTTCTLEDVTAIDLGGGAYDYVGVGSYALGAEACAFRVRADHTIAWSHLYAGEGTQAFHAVVTAANGDVLVAGQDLWTWVGNRASPLVARLDAATGNVLWARKVPMTTFGVFTALVEAPDGTIFASGNAQGTIYTTGAALVARFAADGSDARQALMFEDADWEATGDTFLSGKFDFWPTVDTAGGDTAYDGFDAIGILGESIVVAGTTGLGASTAARMVRLNANLGVEWMSVIDGPSAEGLTGLAVADDGVFVAGYSASLPEADGGAGENQLWALKVPVSGRVKFLPSAGLTARYGAPGVRGASNDRAVEPTGESAIDALLTVGDVPVVSATENSSLLAAPAALCVEKLTSTGHATTSDACP